MARSVPILLAASLIFSVASAAPHRLTLDPEASELAFSFDTTLHKVQGTLALTSGEVVFDPETGNASGEIVVDATRTETGNAKRDRKMHNAVLESSAFPAFVFRAERIDGELRPAGTSEIGLVGSIEVHGEVHPFTLPAVVRIEEDQVSARAEFVIPYVEWGMKNPSLLLLRVSKTVDVAIDARGRLQDHALAQAERPGP